MEPTNHTNHIWLAAVFNPQIPDLRKEAWAD